MKGISKNKVTAILQSIIGCKFRYGIKSPDMDLYDIGFGEDVVFINWLGDLQKTCKYAVHFTCAICLNWLDGKRAVYNSDSDASSFCADIKPLIGLPVKHIEICGYNNILIDLGICQLTIIARKDNHESWRVFSPGQDTDHIVAHGAVLSLE